MQVLVSFTQFWCGLLTENDEIQTRADAILKSVQQQKEFTNWFVCMTLSVLYCLFVLLLTQCMDVEKNPGPGPDHTYTRMLQNMQAAMEWRFSELMGSLQSYTAGISQKNGR